MSARTGCGSSIRCGSGAASAARGEIVGVEEIKGAVQSVVRVTVEIEGEDKPACVVDTISRYFPEA
jgi:acyl dehydratase